MKSHRPLLYVLLALGLPFSGSAGPIIDQSFTAGNDLTAIINECCSYIAQTYTAGLIGKLDFIKIDTAMNGFADPLSLDIQIRSVSGGFPTSTILGEVVFGGTPGFSSAISFAALNVAQVVGVQYAIVVHYVGAPTPPHAEGSWNGASGNLYAGGIALLSTDNGVTWLPPTGSATGFDLHFVTQINTVPEPGTFFMVIPLLGVALLQKRRFLIG